MDTIIGFTTIFIFWAVIIALVSSTLVWHNWSRYVRWSQQSREVQIRMALWLSTPLLFITLAWQHAVALTSYVIIERIPLYSEIQILIYRPIMLFAIALALWYAINRVYYPDTYIADRLWALVMMIGGVLGGVATGLSWWY